MRNERTVRHGVQLAGRGSLSNAAGRYEAHGVAYEDDGWDLPEEEQLLRTHVTFENARKLITYNRSPDLPFDRSINPYRGCEHGCVYCFARPTHAWLGMSPGLDFETRLIARPNAAEVLERELRRAKYKPAVIAIGTNTDPYQPIEKQHKIMRDCLQVLNAFSHPVAIVTKGTLIERDIDILEDMAARKLTAVGVSVTTLDADLSRKMEPRAPAPKRRLMIIRRLAEAGIPVRIMTSPMVPGLTDHEMEEILTLGKEAGAVAASWIMLRLPLEVSGLFREWVERHYPNKANKIMSFLRDMHGGREYSAQWGKRMRGEGPYADLVARRFERITHQLELRRHMIPLDCDQFAPPMAQGAQMNLEF
ncbi:Radical SAM superfamily protein [Roseovarius albus]|uniref:Radical SAM superfamily protein n=1 Tax=Roseovarius albus TaxID=1247867 RepID=A0A1X6YCC1_9RHOB|nr:PA0069 family radical SAM protein [Roseovarius albus]SLN17034.1 Radical SAM superfamily protein [Roseovarius albus]